MTDAWDGGGDLWNELSSLALARLVGRSLDFEANFRQNRRSRVLQSRQRKARRTANGGSIHRRVPVETGVPRIAAAISS